MKNFVLVSITLIFFVVGREESERKLIPELWRNINSHPKFIVSDEMHQAEIEGEFQFIMSAKKISDDTMVVYVSQLDSEAAKRFTKEFRDKRASMGNRALFEMLWQEREEMNSNALDSLASHEENRLAFFREHRKKQ